MESSEHSRLPPGPKDCRIYNLLVSLDKVRESISKIKMDNETNDSGQTVLQQPDQDIRNQTEKLKNELDYIISSLEKLDAFEDKANDLRDRIEGHNDHNLQTLIDRLSKNSPPSGGTFAKKLSGKLRAINKIVFELKLRIPSPHTLSSKDAHQRRGGDGSDKPEGADELPDLHFHTELLESTTFEDFRVVYLSLEHRTKICLLCFAVITENEIVRKSFMIRWWISEGLLGQDEEDTQDKYAEANRIFEELVKKDCIEPVNEKSRFVVNRYRMNPFVRSAVIVLAKEARFFDFHEEKGYPTAICRSSYRACISDGFYPDLVKRISDLRRISELVTTLSNGCKERRCELVKGVFSGACIINGLGKRPSKDSGKRDSALVQRLREIEIKPAFVKELLTEIIKDERKKITSEDPRKGKLAVVKRLQEIEIGTESVNGLEDKEIETELDQRWTELVKELKDEEMEPELGKRLLEIDSELFKILFKDSGKGDSELVKSLGEQIGTDNELVNRLQQMDINSKLGKLLQEIHFKLVGSFSKESEKRDCGLVNRFHKDSQKRNSKLLKRLWEIGIHSVLVKRLQEIGIHSVLVKRFQEMKIGDNFVMVKRLLKMKIGTKLVEKLLENESRGELAIGFFKELATRFSELKGISELKEFAEWEKIPDLIKESSESGERVARSAGVSSDEFGERAARSAGLSSDEWEEIGAKLVHGSSKVLEEIGSVSVIGSSKVLGEIGAELINRFSEELKPKGTDGEFSRQLQDKCHKFKQALIRELGKVGAGLVYGSSEGLEKGGAGSANSPFKEFNPEDVQIIFNVNEPYPDFFHPEWFSKLKNVKVLCLGRWQTSDKHHIEMENIEFLERLESMKTLKFFSLQGISRIRKLPNSICKLISLRFLDIRACNNLEELPEKIGLLEELTYLDISECYLLNVMPKTIKFLSKLQVFKGFVINSNAKSCTLEGLSKLKELRKLGIYTNLRDFPTDDDVKKLYNFKKLQKLTITWGPVAQTDKDAKGPKKGGCTRSWKPARIEESNTGETTIKKLQKLDLKCYPKEEAPSLLLPKNLPGLKKLYIRGGELQSLYPPRQDREWKNVEVLRLKFLNNLKMDWTEVKSSFPRLAYVEKFKCPELTFFPSNENGVWLNEIGDYQRCSSQVDLRLSRS